MAGVVVNEMIMEKATATLQGDRELPEYAAKDSAHQQNGNEHRD